MAPMSAYTKPALLALRLSRFLARQDDAAGNTAGRTSVGTILPSAPPRFSFSTTKASKVVHLITDSIANGGSLGLGRSDTFSVLICFFVPTGLVNRPSLSTSKRKSSSLGSLYLSRFESDVVV